MNETIIMELMSKIGEVKSEVTGLRSDVGHLSTDMAAVKQDVADVKQDIAEVKADTAAIDERLKKLESEPFSVKHLVVFGKWLFSKGGFVALLPILALINVILKGLGAPAMELQPILDFFKAML